MFKTHIIIDCVPLNFLFFLCNNSQSKSFRATYSDRGSEGEPEPRRVIHWRKVSGVGRGHESETGRGEFWGES